MPYWVMMPIQCQCVPYKLSKEEKLFFCSPQTGRATSFSCRSDYFKLPSALGFNPTFTVCHITLTPSLIHLQSKSIWKSFFFLHINQTHKQLSWIQLDQASQGLLLQQLRQLLSEIGCNLTWWAEQIQNICKSECTTTSLYLIHKWKKWGPFLRPIFHIVCDVERKK